jgi:hypothetical protein
MGQHFLIPGVEHGEKTKFGTEPAWLASNGQ